MTYSSTQSGSQGGVAFPPSLAQDVSDRGALSADMMHELANLVMVVSGSLAQLRRQPLDEQGQSQLARAEWAARQVAQLTRRRLSQAQGGDGTPQVVDLNAAVGKFTAVMGQCVTERVQLAADLALGQVPVCLDAGLLELVLLSLVRNATDAMPDGGMVMLCTKGPRLDGLGDRLSVEVSVSDTGIGMAPDVAQHATDAFYTTKHEGKGTRLGLWMAQRFASDCGGKMSIETTPGQGTTVKLAFPYAGDDGQS